MDGIKLGIETAGQQKEISVIKVGGYIDTTTSAELENALETLLQNKTYNIIKLESTCSTNNFAKKLLKTCKQAEYTCIVAEKQTAGRGQRGNFWESERKKNLTFSL